MADYSNRIRSLRRHNKWTQDDLARKLGIDSRSTISNYERGTREPDIEMYEALADVFNVTLDYIRGKPSIPSIGSSGISPLPTTRLLPLLGMIQCGDPILAEENISDFIPVPEYIKADFCLTCKGDSMTGANIYDGDVVFIHKQPDVSSGEIAAVLIDDQATLKRVIKLPGGIILLQPENPKYQPIVLGGESETRSIRIIGKAVHYITRVK